MSRAIVNGRLYTVNHTEPWVEGMLVRDGKIQQLGSSSEIRALAEKHQISVHDLGGKMVMPGLHDAHVHLMMFGMRRVPGAACELPNNAEPDVIVAALKKHQACCGSKDWIQGGVYVADILERLHPKHRVDRDFLDSAFPDVPVAIRETSCHNILVNKVGLDVAGITESCIDPPHGGLSRRKSTGELSGELIETGSRGRVLGYSVSVIGNCTASYSRKHQRTSPIWNHELSGSGFKQNYASSIE